MNFKCQLSVQLTLNLFGFVFPVIQNQVRSFRDRESREIFAIELMLLCQFACLLKDVIQTRGTKVKDLASCSWRCLDERLT